MSPYQSCGLLQMTKETANGLTKAELTRLRLGWLTQLFGDRPSGSSCTETVTLMGEVALTRDCACSQSELAFNLRRASQACLEMVQRDRAAKVLSGDFG